MSQQSDQNVTVSTALENAGAKADFQADLSRMPDMRRNISVRFLCMNSATAATSTVLLLILL